MALIDSTYFVGERNIPDTDKEWVLERLNLIIADREEKFLRDLLGYPMWKAFMAGIQEVTVAPKWSNLLTGAEYVPAACYANQNAIDRWEGLIGTVGGVTVSIIQPNLFEVVVGRGNTYDPVADAASVTIPPEFVGVSFTVEQRGYGTLRSDEFTVSGNTLTLLGVTFTEDDTFFYKTIASLGVSSTALTGRSPIADYVYWHWLKDQATQTVGLGEAAAKAEAATVVTPAIKMNRAWNRMSEQVYKLADFLEVNRDTYAEWYNSTDKYYMLTRYRPDNVFGF